MNKKIQRKKKLIIVGLILFSFCFSTFLYLWYHGNKPIFGNNYIKDDFEDQIPGIFPAGWLSVVHPLNVKIISEDGNNVMEVRDTNSDDVTEISKRYKKTTEGVIECKVKILDDNNGFFIHTVQMDREYNPYDDIIIGFKEGNIYVIEEENIIELNKSEVDDSNWYDFLYPDSDVIWLIDEWKLEDFGSVVKYEINEWISVKIVFNRNEFFLTINNQSLGQFTYPRYNPPYFTGLYFWTFIETSSFKFYIDDVKITLSRPVDYIHPLNIIILFILILFLSLILLFYFKLKKLKS